MQGVGPMKGSNSSMLEDGTNPRIARLEAQLASCRADSQGLRAAEPGWKGCGKGPGGSAARSQVDSAPGKGTRVRVEVPLPPRGGQENAP